MKSFFLGLALIISFSSFANYRIDPEILIHDNSRISISLIDDIEKEEVCEVTVSNISSMKQSSTIEITPWLRNFMKDKGLVEDNGLEIVKIGSVQLSLETDNICYESRGLETVSLRFNIGNDIGSLSVGNYDISIEHPRTGKLQQLKTLKIRKDAETGKISAYFEN